MAGKRDAIWDGLSDVQMCKCADVQIGGRHRKFAMSTRICILKFAHLHICKSAHFPLPLRPIYFLNSKQGNEQLRIDGDLYPCAL